MVLGGANRRAVGADLTTHRACRHRGSGLAAPRGRRGRGGQQRAEGSTATTARRRGRRSGRARGPSRTVLHLRGSARRPHRPDASGAENSGRLLTRPRRRRPVDAVRPHGRYLRFTGAACARGRLPVGAVVVRAGRDPEAARRRARARPTRPTGLHLRRLGAPHRGARPGRHDRHPRAARRRRRGALVARRRRRPRLVPLVGRRATPPSCPTTSGARSPGARGAGTHSRARGTAPASASP
jgi:hypothetical protein